jgi:hypothetical protein
LSGRDADRECSIWRVVSYLNSIAESNRKMMGWIALIGWMALFTFDLDVGIPMMKAVHWWPWSF